MLADTDFACEREPVTTANRPPHPNKCGQARPSHYREEGLMRTEPGDKNGGVKVPMVSNFDQLSAGQDIDTKAGVGPYPRPST